MSPINSLKNTNSTVASSTRPMDTDNGLSKVAGGFSGLEAFQASQSSTSFSLGNPGFGSRSADGAFSVSNFLG